MPIKLPVSKFFPIMPNLKSGYLQTTPQQTTLGMSPLDKTLNDIILESHLEYRMIPGIHSIASYKLR